MVVVRLVGLVSIAVMAGMFSRIRFGMGTGLWQLVGLGVLVVAQLRFQRITLVVLGE